MERPDEWAGRKMDDITPAEMQAAIAKRQQDAVEFAPFFGGGEPEAGVALAVPSHWFDTLAAVNARAWCVIGQTAGPVPEAGQTPAAAAWHRRARRRLSARRNARPLQRAAPSERCITFQTPWRTPITGNAHQLMQNRDYVVFRRNGSRSAPHPVDGRPHAGAAVRVLRDSATGMAIRWLSRRPTST